MTTPDLEDRLEELEDRLVRISEKVAAIEKAIFFLLNESRLWNARLLAHDIEKAGKGETK